MGEQTSVALWQAIVCLLKHTIFTTILWGRHVLVVLFYRWENWVPENLISLSKVAVVSLRGRIKHRQPDSRIHFSTLLVFKLHIFTFSFSLVFLHFIFYNDLLTGQTILYQSLLYTQRKTFVLLFLKHTSFSVLIAYARGPRISLYREKN